MFHQHSTFQLQSPIRSGSSRRAVVGGGRLKVTTEDWEISWHASERAGALTTDGRRHNACMTSRDRGRTKKEEPFVKTEPISLPLLHCKSASRLQARPRIWGCGKRDASDCSPEWAMHSMHSKRCHFMMRDGQHRQKWLRGWISDQNKRERQHCPPSDFVKDIAAARG